MAYKVSTAPSTEPLTRAFVKTWLKIPSSVTAEDDIVDALIKAARVWAESGTGRALMTQTIEDYFDCFPSCSALYLSVAPIQSISSIQYLSGGSYTTWNASNYNADLVSNPCRITLKNTGQLPSYDLDTANAIKVTYSAGYSSADNVPAQVKHAMLQKIAFMYENREDIPLGGNSNAARTRSADALLSTERML